MANETQIECYFKSSELAELCKKGKDIIINFKASYPPDASPKFEITANVFTRGKRQENQLNLHLWAMALPVVLAVPNHVDQLW